MVFRAVLELPDLVAQHVARLVEPAIEQGDAARPSRVQRIERSVEAERGRFSVARVGVHQTEPRVPVAEVRIKEVELHGLTIDVVAPGDAHPLTRAQQVLLLDLGADLVLAAGPAVAETRG